MSYFSIKDFIKAGEKSLKDGNYWSALSVALALPSICSRIEFDKPENINTYFTIKSNGEKQWKDRKCYIDFCNQIMRVNQRSTSLEGELDKYLTTMFGDNLIEVLYQLRCGFVHEGNIEFCANDKRIYFSLGENGTNADFEDKRTIKVKDLCEEIFYYIKCWCEKQPDTVFKNVFIFDMDNSKDDRDKYCEYCANARKEYKENNNHINNYKI